jgi:hypothetical protein
VCYNVACASNDDIAEYRAGALTGGQFLARLKWKVGHSSDWERRQREYEKCDVGQTHIWVCRWEVDRRYYCGVSFFFPSFIRLILNLGTSRTARPTSKVWDSHMLPTFHIWTNGRNNCTR